MKNQRLKFIDMAKGLAITAMVLGHCYSVDGGFIIRYIYSFHMPLFFITTGVLYGIRDNESKSLQISPNNILKRVKSLMIPYLIWGTIYQLFIAFLKIVGGAPIMENLKEGISNVLRCTGSAMWFLPVMLSSVLVFFIFRRYMRIKIFTLIITLITMIVCTTFKFEFEYLNIFLRVLIGTGYIVIGYSLSNIFCYRYSNLQLFSLLVLQILITEVNGTVSIASLLFGNPILYILMGVNGTLIIYAACKHIEDKIKISELLSWWGENSIKILCWHGIVIQIIRLRDYKIFGDLLPLLGIIEGIVLTGIVMSMLSLALKIKCPIIDRSFGMNTKT